VKILNLTQHEATEEQKQAGVIEPENKKRIQELLTFDSVPSKEQMELRARELALIAKQELGIASKAVMVGGAPYFMSTLERVLKQEGFQVCYAFSKRECVEERQSDGSVVKKTLFRHIGFVWV